MIYWFINIELTAVSIMAEGSLSNANGLFPRNIPASYWEEQDHVLDGGHFK